MRREKYVEHGGPDGGDGGRGGHVILRADSQLGSLLDLRGRALWRAGDGTHGGARNKTGADGESLTIRVPVGTLVRDNVEDITLCELLVDGEERIVVEGGKPGLGNMHFKTATNRAPRETTPGGLGVHRRVGLELKLVADVGLLGFPNAGKSTLISVISAARPKIADYPFTTLVPNLGVVAADDVGGSFVVADIPGLIEGAAEGRGLGLQFLRHVERTRMLLHLVALDEEEPTPVRRWQILRDELRRYDTDLLDRPEIVVLTKSDVVDAKALTAVRKAFAKAGVPEVHVISAATRQGVSALIESVWTQLRAHSASPPAGV